MDMTFRRLQEEQGEWAMRNFGARPSHQPLLGAVEELGELAHAHLKSEQGIRGAQEHHAESKRDAVADIIVFLADYCNLEGFDMQELIEETWADVRLRDWKKNPDNGEASPKSVDIEDHSFEPECAWQWCCGCDEHPIGKPWGWNHRQWELHYEQNHQ